MFFWLDNFSMELALILKALFLGDTLENLYPHGEGSVLPMNLFSFFPVMPVRCTLDQPEALLDWT